VDRDNNLAERAEGCGALGGGTRLLKCGFENLGFWGFSLQKPKNLKSPNFSLN